MSITSLGKGRSEEPGAGVGAVEDAVGDGVVGGLRQVHAVPVGVRRRVRAHARPPHAAARLRVEVVRPAAAAARPQRTLREPCMQRAVSEKQGQFAEIFRSQDKYIGLVWPFYKNSERVF